MKFSSAAIIFFATLSVASAKVGTKSAKSSDGKSTKTNKSSKTQPTSFPTTIGGDPAPGPGPVPPTPVTSSPTATPITPSPSKAPVTSSPTKAPATLSPTSAPTSAPVLFPTSSPVKACPSHTTCTNCIGDKCKTDDDCCLSNYEECTTTGYICYDYNAPADAKNCTMTCDDPYNRTLVLEQCAGLGVPDNQIYCSRQTTSDCIDSTLLDGECDQNCF
eukprot:scaffold140006_cov39-Cyclotella_meneghiniana.AAC.1